MQVFGLPRHVTRGAALASRPQQRPQRRRRGRCRRRVAGHPLPLASASRPGPLGPALATAPARATARMVAATGDGSARGARRLPDVRQGQARHPAAPPGIRRQREHVGTHPQEARRTRRHHTRPNPPSGDAPTSRRGPTARAPAAEAPAEPAVAAGDGTDHGRFRAPRPAREDYASYTRSFINIADPRIQRKVDTALDADAFWPEPLLQLNPVFKPGGTIDDPVAEGILHEECARVFRLDKTDADPAGKQLPLYACQAEAIRLASVWGTSRRRPRRCSAARGRSSNGWSSRTCVPTTSPPLGP